MGLERFAFRVENVTTKMERFALEMAKNAFDVEKITFDTERVTFEYMERIIYTRENYNQVFFQQNFTLP